MKIDKRKRDDVTILDLEGKITIGKGDVALREAVQEALERRRDEDPRQPRQGHDDRLLRRRRAGVGASPP